LSSGFVPGGPFVAPGVVAGLTGVLVVGLEMEFRPVGESADAWPFGRFVLILGRADDDGRSSASGGDRAGKLMTWSRKGTE
jgi:hypothetical protein